MKEQECSCSHSVVPMDGDWNPNCPVHGCAPTEEELKPWTVDYDGTDYCLVENGRTFALVEDQHMAYKIMDAHNATLTRRASIPEQEKERIAEEWAMKLNGDLLHEPFDGTLMRCVREAFSRAINEALNWTATNSQDVQINAKD